MTRAAGVLLYYDKMFYSNVCPLCIVSYTKSIRYKVNNFPFVSYSWFLLIWRKIFPVTLSWGWGEYSFSWRSRVNNTYQILLLFFLCDVWIKHSFHFLERVRYVNLHTLHLIVVSNHMDCSILYILHSYFSLHHLWKSSSEPNQMLWTSM